MLQQIYRFYKHNICPSSFLYGSLGSHHKHQLHLHFGFFLLFGYFCVLTKRSFHSYIYFGSLNQIKSSRRYKRERTYQNDERTKKPHKIPTERCMSIVNAKTNLWWLWCGWRFLGNSKSTKFDSL